MFVVSCSPRKFAQEFIKSLKERAEKVPNAGRRAGSGQVIKLGSDCTGLSSDFVALKFALGASVKLQTAFISDTWVELFIISVEVLVLVFDVSLQIFSGHFWSWLVKLKDICQTRRKMAMQVHAHFGDTPEAWLQLVLNT